MSLRTNWGKIRRNGQIKHAFTYNANDHGTIAKPLINDTPDRKASIQQTSTLSEHPLISRPVQTPWYPSTIVQPSARNSLHPPPPTNSEPHPLLLSVIVLVRALLARRSELLF